MEVYMSHRIKKCKCYCEFVHTNSGKTQNFFVAETKQIRITRYSIKILGGKNIIIFFNELQKLNSGFRGKRIMNLEL